MIEDKIFIKYVKIKKYKKHKIITLMFILKCKIEIGNFIFNSVNDVEITKSVTELVDTEVIKMPTKFKIRQNNEQKNIEEVIKAGDPVKITLAYEGKYEGVEFVGFVKKVNPKIPIEIHCEDAMWLLRRKNISKSWKKTTLKEVLDTAFAFKNFVA